MQPDLLELLVCPHDGSALTPDGDAALACGDGHVFPIRDDVPRLTPDESGPLGDQTGTFDSFSAKWSQVDSDEVRQRFDAQYAWYVQRFGFGDEGGLRDFLAGKRFVLEAGTGVGGDAARFARLSDATVIGLDLSESIVTAQREFGAAENLHYIQADLLRPPLSRPVASTSCRPTRSSTTRPTRRPPWGRSRACSRPAACSRSTSTSVKAPLREYADDYIRERTTKMSVEDCMELQRGHERARPQALGPRRDDHARARHPAARHPGGRARRAAARSTGTSSSASGTTTSRRT